MRVNGPAPSPPAPPPPAETEIWSATLTPGVFSGVFGCHFAFAQINAAMDCASSSVLSDDEFTHDTTTYTIQILQVTTNTAGDASLLINVTPNFTDRGMS